MPTPNAVVASRFSGQPGAPGTTASAGTVLLAVASSASADPAWNKVAAALGRAGTELPGGVYRIAPPRTDIKAMLDGVTLNAGFAFRGRPAFQNIGDAAMVMGNLDSAQDQVNPVMAKLLAGGIEAAALHNHLLRNRPLTIYMHACGPGDPVTLATARHAGLTEGNAPLVASIPPKATPQIDPDTAAPDRILGAKGANNGGGCGYDIRRVEPVTDTGMTVPAASRSAIEINFQPAGGGKAAITGDFVRLGSEYEPVLKDLRDSGIEVTAVHDHIVDQQSRVFFVHCRAKDDAKRLAQGLKAALDRIKIARG